MLGLEREEEGSKMFQLMMQVHGRGKISYGPERMVRVLMLALRLDVESESRIH